MFCGHCGKRVMEYMLFCPYCGAEVVVPDTDKDSDEKSAPPRAKHASTIYTEDAPASDAEDTQVTDAEDGKTSDAEDAFEPLRFDFDAAEAEADAGEVQDIPTEEAPTVPPAADAPAPKDAPPAVNAAESVPKGVVPTTSRRRAAVTPVRDADKRISKTYIPLKTLDPTDMFMDGDMETDAYDLADEDDIKDDYIYEEPEHGTFVQRHVRGIVSILLFLLLVVITLIWSVTSSGQQALAKLNLAWEADAYARLGLESYDGGSYTQAAAYYEKALDHDESNYEYAHSAMVAWYDAGNIGSATAMLKVCISLQPDNAEPYSEMKILYPDAATRPAEITQLLRDGYTRTGNASLNPDAG